MEFEIICKNNGKRLRCPGGTPIGDLIGNFGLDETIPILGVLVNNKIQSLNTPLYCDRTIEYVYQNTPLGQRIYMHTAVFVLYKALRDTLPNARLRVGQAISNGYFCEISQNGQKISINEFARLKEHIHQLIKADLPIEPHYAPTTEVEALLDKQLSADALGLLKYQRNFYTYYYRLGDTADFYNSLLMPSTSYLRCFELCDYFDGFLLRLPDPQDPYKALAMTEQNKLYELFKENNNWGRLVGINSITDLNNIPYDDVNMYIKITEALHEKKIVRIADEITNNKQIKVVLIAGPSSSGKTTFSKRLSIQLAASGVRSYMLSLDNYFVNRCDTPTDIDGGHDFESLYALDLPCFNQQLKQLTLGEKVETPVYNFETGMRDQRTIPIQLGEGEVLIIEGIHGLNPELTASISDQNKYKIFVSALTSLPLNCRNWIDSYDIRLLRRIIRDKKYRAYPAEQTILRWPSVRRGEEKWILPFQKYANQLFNSSLPFELAVICSQAVPALQEVFQYSDAYPEARRLLELLRFFKPIAFNDTPTTSLLREFVGGSGFKY